MESAQSAAQQLQQQQQTNAMLSQLPQAQQSQIEQAVSQYRQKLQQAGHNGENIQLYVWTYYTQCVEKLYAQNQSESGSGSTSLQAATETIGQDSAAALQSLGQSTGASPSQAEQMRVSAMQSPVPSSAASPSQAPSLQQQFKFQQMQLAQAQQAQQALQAQQGQQAQQRQQFEQEQQMQQQLQFQQQQQLQRQQLQARLNAGLMGKGGDMTAQPKLGNMGNSWGGASDGMSPQKNMVGSFSSDAGSFSQGMSPGHQMQMQQDESASGFAQAGGDQNGPGGGGFFQAPNAMQQSMGSTMNSLGQTAKSASPAIAKMPPQVQSWNMQQGQDWGDGFKGEGFEGEGFEGKGFEGKGQGFKGKGGKGECFKGEGFKGKGMGKVNGKGMPLMQLRGKGMAMTTPLQRMQMQQAQHEQRILHQQQQQQQQQSAASTGNWATSPGGMNAKGMAGQYPRPLGTTAAIRPQRPGMVNAGLGGGMQRPQGATGQNFPPALQKWLQKLFQAQTQSGESDSSLQKLTHVYLRYWVQQWVKTGELWQRNWEAAPLPTPDEIRNNKPPGSLSGASGGADLSAIPRPPGPRIVAPPPRVPTEGKGASGEKGADMQGTKGGFGQMGFDNKPRQPGLHARSWSGKERSRSRSGGRGKGQAAGRRRRSATPRRRRARKSSTSRSRSSSRSRSRSRSKGKGDASSESSKSGDASGNENAGAAKQPKAVIGPNWGAKGKGKKGGKGGQEEGHNHLRGKLSHPSPEEQKKTVRAFLDERLMAGDWRGRHKELQKEIERGFAMNAKKFKQVFQQTIVQYVVAFYVARGEPPNATAPITSSKILTPGEQHMRAQRAARFQTHLQVERTTVAMVSFNDGDGTCVPGGPIVGALDAMCSREEAKEREMTRQLDKFEWKKGTNGAYAEVNLELATKKYQRSSADKAYLGKDVRTLDACWRTMEYLMTEVLDSDIIAKEKFAVQNVPYIDVYSYLRDRTRSCRVDLHLQQPRSTTTQCFVQTHECCLRFEMLSLYLLQGAQSGGSGSSTEKYDEKLGLKAISQTIEPLLNAYQGVRDKQLAKSILAEAMGGLCLDDGDGDGDAEYGSPFEAAAHRYIVLLLMAFSAEELLTHLAKLSRDTLSHPLVSFATQAYAAFTTDDYGRFLRLYREADFLTAVAMSGVADLARMRALWLLVRCTPPGVADKVKLSRIRTMLAFASDEHARSFLAFHGVKVVDDAGADKAYAALPKRNSPEAAQHPLLSGSNKLPDKCDYPKGADSMLVSKFEELSASGLSRADIIFGSADPIVVVEDSGANAESAEAPMDTAEEKSSSDQVK